LSKIGSGNQQNKTWSSSWQNRQNTIENKNKTVLPPIERRLSFLFYGRLKFHLPPKKLTTKKPAFLQ
jgi:hypothetical protein